LTEASAHEKIENVASAIAMPGAIRSPVEALAAGIAMADLPKLALAGRHLIRTSAEGKVPSPQPPRAIPS